MNFPVSVCAGMSDFFTAEHSKLLDESRPWGYRVSWTVAEGSITLGVEAKTDGWVGFGIAELSSGSMPGADMVIGYFDDRTNKIVVKDTYALNYVTPLMDDSQDWQVLGGSREGGVTMFAAKRKLNTGDSQDREIVLTQAVPIVIATGAVSTGRWSYHSNNRQALFMDFRNANPPDPLLALKADPDVFFFDMFNNHTITKKATQYIDFFSSSLPSSTLPDFLRTVKECADSLGIQQQMGLTCGQAYNLLASTPATGTEPTHPCDVSFPGIEATLRETGMCPLTCGSCVRPETAVVQKYLFDDVHLIGWEPIIEPENRQHVHHFVLYGNGKGIKESTNTFYAWAPGSQPKVTPSECGFRMSPSKFTDLQMNTHYDNPTGEGTGRVDHSGVRVYYTKKLRPHDCGLLQLGDGRISLFGQRFPQGDSRTSFVCRANKLAEILGNTTVTLVETGLHMHGIGKRAWTTQTTTDGQGNSVTTELSRNDFYNIAFQIAVPLTGRTMKAGDSFSTSCVHSSPDGEQKWGLESSDEMCIDFIMYWPALDGLEYCGRSVEVHTKLTNDVSCYGNKNCADVSAVPVLVECNDDPTGDVARAGVDCDTLVGMGCEVDLSTLNPAVSKGMLVKMLCPSSCNYCNPNIPSAPRRPPPPGAPPAAGSPTHATAPATSGSGSDSSCANHTFTIVNAGFAMKCWEATSPAVLRTRCTNSSSSSITLLRSSGSSALGSGSSSSALVSVRGTAVMLSTNGMCLNQGFKFGPCSAEVSVVVESAVEGGVSLKLPTGMCVNALPTGILNVAKCNPKVLTQRFYLKPTVV